MNTIFNYKLSLDWVEDVKQIIPDYAKDIKENSDDVMNKCYGISREDARYLALSAAYAGGNSSFAQFIYNSLDNDLDKNAAVIASTFVKQDTKRIFYNQAINEKEFYDLPSKLKNDLVDSCAGTEKTKFNGYLLSAAIVSESEHHIFKSYNNLKEYGYEIEQLRDIGRIATVVNSVSSLIKL